MSNVFFDINKDDNYIGRIVFKLYDDVVPKTAKNFRELATGQHEHGYKGSSFHAIYKGSRICGGDFINNDGSGGESIYGGPFKDENFKKKHDKRGILSMANSGKNTNRSQFFITTASAPGLDGKHVVFGEVVKGYEVVQEIEKQGDGAGNLKAQITIAKSGTL